MPALIASAEREATIRCLREHAGELRRRKVRSLRLFGSMARGEAGFASDVDLLVEFSASVGLFAFIRLQLYLESLLGRKVDLVTEDALRPEMRNEIEAEAIRVA